MSFYVDEAARIEDALLIILGVQPSEIGGMSCQQRQDVLALWDAIEALKRGKMPGEK